MLANADIKVLEDEEDEDQETEVDLEANRQKRIKKKTENDTLTSEQMNQVGYLNFFCKSDCNMDHNNVQLNELWL